MPYDHGLYGERPAYGPSGVLRASFVWIRKGPFVLVSIVVYYQLRSDFFCSVRTRCWLTVNNRSWPMPVSHKVKRGYLHCKSLVEKLRNTRFWKILKIWKQEPGNKSITSVTTSGNDRSLSWNKTKKNQRQPIKIDVLKNYCCQRVFAWQEWLCHAKS